METAITTQKRAFRKQFIVFLLVCHSLIITVTTVPYVVYGQVTTSITATSGGGNLSTVVKESNNVYTITGGTRPGNGTNLFHSFDSFSIGTANTANFLNTPVNGSLLPTSNILARVTGGNISQIFGTVQTTGFGNANLFLMNPAGFLFGANATMNVGGTVTFTSADYIKLAEGGRFNGIPTATPTDVLTVAPVVAFGFLGVRPGGITVQGSQFSGTGISFIGGDITIAPGTLANGAMQSAKLSASSGQLNLVSVASSGEVLASTFEPAPSMTLGAITLDEGSLVNVSGNAGGTVRIRGGSLVMNQAVISADTINTDAAPIAIDINVTGYASITNLDMPALTARTTGLGNAGEIRIAADRVNVNTLPGENIFFSALDTHTSGSGNAGNVSIHTGNLNVTGDPLSGATFFIDSGTSGPAPGRGGEVTISAQEATFDNTAITTGNLIAFFSDEGGAGTAGNVTITADRLNMTLSQIVTDSSDFVNPTGRSGDITLFGHHLSFDSSSLSTAGNERSGSITISADQFIAKDTGIQATTNLKFGGEIRINANVVELKEGSNLASSTMGDGHAGPIIITASDHLSFLESSPGGRPGGVFNNSFGVNGSVGNAGDVSITTPHLQLTGGTRINTTTATSGRGGNVTINSKSISMSGESGGFESEPLFNLGTVQSSGIYTRTIGGNCAGPCGNAGNVSINTAKLAMETGAQINSGTSSSGQGGHITINAGDNIAISGTLSTGQPGGIQSHSIGTAPDAGPGGGISLTAGKSISLKDGAAISASSKGPGDAGNVSINAGKQLDVRNGSITTEAIQASGGNIDIKAINLIRVVNSPISSSVQGGPTTTGGNITIDPNVVILQNARILANAQQGNGGNITITTPVFLQDQASRVDASSRFGVNGTVTIQSPTSNLSGTVKQLPSKPSETQALLHNRCAALAGGEQSTFILTGRDALPSEPGGWLSSPMAVQTGTGHGHEGLSRLMERKVGWRESSAMIAQVAESKVLSLRRLTPPGFLVRSFAVTGSEGCHS